MDLSDKSYMVKHGPSGGLRASKEGKGRYDLISSPAMRRLALWYEEGARIHGDRNWEMGISISGCISSILRHTFKYLAGSHDEDHLAAVAWNAFAIMHFEERPTIYDGHTFDLPWQAPESGAKSVR